MKRDLNQLAAGFRQRQQRRHKVGVAPSPVDVELSVIHRNHVASAGAAMQVIMVPIPADSQGTQNDTGFPLWPQVAAGLTGTTRTLALKSALTELAMQGQLSNCWALSTVFSLIEANYAVMQSRIVVLPNGNIGMYCFINGDINEPVTLECTYTLANLGSGLGAGHFIAIKAFELLLAFGRYMKEDAQGHVTTTVDTLNDENYGWMYAMFQLLGIPCQQVSINTSTALSLIASNLTAGKAVTFGTPGITSGGYVEGHAYSVFLDYTVTPAVATAVNPWGVQGQ